MLGEEDRADCGCWEEEDEQLCRSPGAMAGDEHTQTWSWWRDGICMLMGLTSLLPDLEPEMETGGLILP